MLGSRRMGGKPNLLEADDGKKKGKTCKKKNSFQPGGKTGNHCGCFPGRNSNFHELNPEKSGGFNQIENR